MHTVEVFKTNVHCHEGAALLLEVLKEKFPRWKINFDLHDCDNILRVEGEYIAGDAIIRLLGSRGYQCEVLE